MGTFHEYHGQRPTGMGVAGSHLASSSQRRHPFTGSTTSNDKAADATDDGRKSRWQRTSGTRSILRSREYLVRYANQGVTEVLPGLFLGDWNSSFPRSLQEHGITAIVSVCSEPSLGWEAPGTAIPELGIKVESTRSLVCRCHHLWLRVEDCENFNIYKYFQAACIFIDQHWSHAARPEFKNKSVRTMN